MHTEKTPSAHTNPAPSRAGHGDAPPALVERAGDGPPARPRILPHLTALRVAAALALALLAAAAAALLSGALPALRPPVDAVRQLTLQLNHALRRLIDTPSATGLLGLFGASLAYGFVHSAGPGHGKALITSYLVRERHGARRAVALASVASLTHVLGAVLLAALLTLVLTGFKGLFRVRLHSYMVLANGLAIAVVGMVYLVFAARRHHPRPAAPPASRGIVGMGVLAGMVPCPGSLVVLLFAVARDALWLGLLSVFGISLGMLALLAPLAIATSASRTGLLALARRADQSVEAVARWLEYLSIALILTIGAVMIASSL